jgi:hypothetical protein
VSRPSMSPSGAGVTGTTPTASSRDFTLFMRPIYRPAIVDLVRYYGWKRIYYIYDSPEGRYVRVGGRWLGVAWVSHNMTTRAYYLFITNMIFARYGRCTMCLNGGCKHIVSNRQRIADTLLAQVKVRREDYRVKYYICFL